MPHHLPPLAVRKPRSVPNDVKKWGDYLHNSLPSRDQAVMIAESNEEVAILLPPQSIITMLGLNSEQNDSIRFLNRLVHMIHLWTHQTKLIPGHQGITQSRNYLRGYDSEAGLPEKNRGYVYYLIPDSRASRFLGCLMHPDDYRAIYSAQRNGAV
jgi:hypothetical protein